MTSTATWHTPATDTLQPMLHGGDTRGVPGKNNPGQALGHGQSATCWCANAPERLLMTAGEPLPGH